MDVNLYKLEWVAEIWVQDRLAQAKPDRKLRVVKEGQGSRRGFTRILLKPPALRRLITHLGHAAS
jgi:hypothetical protein